MRILLTGDLLVTRTLRAAIDTGRLEAFRVLGRDCDAIIGNLETLFHSFTWPPSAYSGGTWLQCDRRVASELRELGFSAVARANNHALDYGVGALIETSRELDRAGIRHAGAGMDLDDALQPALLDTKGSHVNYMVVILL
jgi:poly-gamma-glutamate synthesis protein (capsule biosynthesis protein)